MSMYRYEINDKLATADVMFKAYGKTLNESFESAAYAMFNVMTDVSKVKKTLKFEFEKKSEDLKSLLYDFLEELLFIHETKGVFLSNFKVAIDESNFSLKAAVSGEKIKKTHKKKSMVKAITYFDMKIEKTKEGYLVQVLLDI